MIRIPFGPDTEFGQLVNIQHTGFESGMLFCLSDRETM